MDLNLSEISNILGCPFDCQYDKKVSEIKIDSRSVSNGDIFVAINGEHFDGHNFVSNAFSNGAIASIVEKDIEIDDKSKILFKVENSIEALHKVAEFYRSKFDIKVIGITGSVGKSTVKEMVYSIFSTELKTIKSDGNQNGQIGLPLSVFKIDDQTQIAVLEMGISEPGNMKNLAKIAKPDFAIINNIGSSHIGNFATVNDLIKEKYDITSFSNCRLYVNGDNSDLVEFLKDKKNIVYFGIDENFPYSASSVTSTENQTEFILNSPNFTGIINIPCFGIHNVYNALSSISIALDFGIHIDDVKGGLCKFKTLSRRQDVIKLKNFTIVDDSYNASPDSIKAAINFLKSLEGKGRCIAVIADILELGSYSCDIHYDLGKYMASSQLDILITVGNDSQNINIGLESLNKNLHNVHFSNNNDVYEYICKIVQDGDKILIKGSLAMKVDEIVQKLIKKFGDDIEKS